MSDSTFIAAPARRRALLVSLVWGDPALGFGAGANPEGGAAYYTTWSEPLFVGSGGGARRYEPLAGIEVDLPREGLSLEPEPFTLTMPRSVEPFRSVVRRAHASIDVKVERVDPDDMLVRRVVAWGRLLERDFTLGAAPSPTPGVAGGDDFGARVVCRCATLKHHLRASLGLIASPICNWDPGRGECAASGGMTLDEITLPGVVTAIDGPVVTVDLLADFPAFRGVVQPAGWARFGTLRRGSIVLDILDHDNDTGRALVSAEPPASWLDATVGVTAGCPGTAQACAERFNNTQRFAGYGVALPDYNPAFSSGRS